MDLARLIEALSHPSAYPHSAEQIEVLHTHVSVVFLAGPFAYKIKKPLDLGFLDFTTLEKRRHFCLEEVRLNRRLAPRVYLGVVPIAVGADGLRADGEGEVVEWAVWMERLPEEATLSNRLRAGEVGAAAVRGLARRLASFHSTAERGPHITPFGRWAVVARNCRENFAQTGGHVGVTVSAAVRGRLSHLTEEALSRLRPLIERRADDESTCDTHGDLHLDHVYLFPERPPPDDVLIVDCIEFNERFRYSDPLADLAFLAMDFAFHGRRDLAECLCREWGEASGDGPDRDLLAFYVAYRAAVRAKVGGFAALEAEVPEVDRARAWSRARAHWLLALGALERLPRRPCLVLVGGLPGTGKSTLARQLAEAAGFQVISTDRVRKELAGLASSESGRAAFGEGIYSEGWTDRVYRECLGRAEALLFEGQRVLVDATFREESKRRLFLGAASRWAVPAMFLVCSTPPEAVRRRLAARQGGASDADWDVYLEAAAAWEDQGAEASAASVAVPTAGGAEQAVSVVLERLRAEDLA